MNEQVEAHNLKVQRASEHLTALRAEISRVFIGQPETLEQVLTALLAGGHVLVEGVPGLGKTLLVKSLARCIGTGFARIQFTPDLMPADVTGHALLDMSRNQFEIRRGPVFTNLLLADEINRAPAKTQAALLEVMQERQVTIEGETLSLSEPFMVLATQNPIEQEGTYPLPEAELDRFLMKISIGYPAAEEELAIVRAVTEDSSALFPVADLTPRLNAGEVVELQQLAACVEVDDAVLDYAVRLARASRDWPGLARGAGPRASIALVRCAKAYALLSGRGFALPDDIKEVAPAVLAHRVQLTADREIEGQTAAQVLQELLSEVEAPRQ